LENVACDVDVNCYAIVQPTSVNAAGLWMPDNNNNATCWTHNVMVMGYYTGVVTGEHSNHDELSIQSCYQSVLVPNAYHSSYINKAKFQQSPYGLVFIGSTQAGPTGHYLNVSFLDLEHNTNGGPAWMNKVYDIVDTHNYGHGRIDAHTVTAAVGVDNSFANYGGANLRVTRVATGYQYALLPTIPYVDFNVLSGAALHTDPPGSGQTGGQSYQSPATTTDKMNSTVFLLPAGTYHLSLFGSSGSGNGQQTLYLKDAATGATLATFGPVDWYSAANTYNVTNTTASVANIPAGNYYVESDVSGKNASATAYYIAETSVAMVAG